MDHLCELPNDAARRKALNTLPPTLHETYERILQRVNRCSKEVQLLVQRSLRWLLCSKEQLTSLALCEAVSIESGDTTLDRSAVPDEEEILRRCSSLVRRSASGKSLELAHFTVKEFLTTGIDPLDKEYNFYRVRSEVEDMKLAQTCLTYLSLDDFGSGNRESLTFSYKRFELFALRQYAVQYWAEHSRKHLANPEVMYLTQQLLHPSKPLVFVSWTQDFLWAQYRYEHGVLDQRRSCSMTDLSTMSPLHFAALLALPESCAWLLQNGCYVDQTSACGRPLQCALLSRCAFEDELENYEWPDDEDFSPSTTVKLIIDNGADVQKSGILGPSYLFMALFRSDKTSCIELLRKGATIDPKSAEYLAESENYCGGLAYDIHKCLGEEDIRPKDRMTLLEATLRHEELLENAYMDELGDILLDCRDARMDCLVPFLTAAEYGQLSVLKQLFHDHKLHVDAIGHSGQRAALHLAALNEHIKIVEFLHEHGADPNLPDRQGRTPLHASVEKSGRYLCLQFFLNQNVSFKVTDDQGITPWHLAALQGNAHALSILKEFAPENETCFRSKDNEGRTPLHYAAQSGSKETLIFLLDHDDKHAIHDESSDGMTALHYCVKACRLDIDSSHCPRLLALEALLSYRANPPSEDLMGKTALVSLVEMWEKFFLRQEDRGTTHFHIPEGYVNLFSKILANTKIVSFLASVCKDPHFLCLALIFGQEQLAKDILKYSPPIDAIAYRLFHMSPLQAACYYGRCSRPLLGELQGRSKADRGASGVVSELLLFACKGLASSWQQVVLNLLDLGSDPNQRSLKGETAIMIAAERGHAAAVKMLIDHGADVSTTDNNGWSVTHHACRSASEEVLSLIKSVTVDWDARITLKINGVFIHNATVLHIAALGPSPALSFLLTNDLMTDINSLTDRKETALWFAAVCGNSRNVSLLLDKSANDTIRNCDSESPLHVAIRVGFLNVVETFIDKGCDLLLQDGSGFTPELIARRYGRIDIANLLKEKTSAEGMDEPICLDFASSQLISTRYDRLPSHG